ncbi:hypothetical protein [Variovorax sp. PBL-E5]|uniref:hypothetical protein n=1 Tax=Variovorax sp. PBL-E5 TaxID=434014 RepID=UPI0013A5871C|nr:hypothetical protein [Variovorax sp. PBL-E5]
MPALEVKVTQKDLHHRSLCVTFTAMTKQEMEERARIGRPPLPEDQKAVTSSLRLTPARWLKLRQLGMAWLNRAIDKAKLPTE